MKTCANPHLTTDQAAQIGGKHVVVVTRAEIMVPDISFPIRDFDANVRHIQRIMSLFKPASEHAPVMLVGAFDMEADWIDERQFWAVWDLWFAAHAKDWADCNLVISIAGSSKLRSRYMHEEPVPGAPVYVVKFVTYDTINTPSTPGAQPFSYDCWQNWEKVFRYEHFKTEGLNAEPGTALLETVRDGKVCVRSSRDRDTSDTLSLITVVDNLSDNIIPLTYRIPRVPA